MLAGLALCVVCLRSCCTIRIVMHKRSAGKKSKKEKTQNKKIQKKKKIEQRLFFVSLEEQA